MASGDTLFIFTAQSNVRITSGAEPDVRNQHLVLDFDDSTDEHAVFEFVMPRNYAATTGVTVSIFWAATSATSGDVVWNSAFERMNTDTDSDSYATANAVTDTTNGTAGIIETATIAHTDGAQIDSIAVAEAGRLKISRDANNASDTMTGDAELFRVEIKET